MLTMPTTETATPSRTSPTEPTTDPTTTQIVGVRLLNPGHPMLDDATVEFRGATITWTGPRVEALRRPADQRIDGQGALCLPGFVNTHNHSPLCIVRGMVEDLGFAPAYTPGIPQGHWLSDEETYLLARLGQMELLCAGNTTVVDYYRKPLALAQAAHDSGLRAFIGGRVMDADSAELAEGRFRRDARLGDETLRDSQDLIARWDGADDGRIRAVHAPHAADTCSRALLTEMATLARADGRAVHTHLAQSQLEVAQVLGRDGCRPLQLFDELGLLGPQLFAAHAIFLNEGEVARAGQAGLTVCHAPIGNATFGATAPIEALQAAGACITLCTDSKSADMFETMRMAIVAARVRAAGRFVFNAAQMFTWATAGGAQALGLDDVGRVEPGCRADLVLLDPCAANLAPVVDGYGIVVHSGSASNVREVYVDGQLRVHEGRPTAFDAAEVLQAAQAVADRLWARARAA
jgi:5-methylthioadenosine/S-adenosylhomocysteine deaminase